MDKEEMDLTDPKTLRTLAEKSLKQKNIKSKDTILDINEKRLIHELQVHQIELVMQNEELQKANDIAVEALKKYTMLYDFAPMGYFTLDSECKICDLNFTGAEMLGEKRFSLENTNFTLFILEEYKPVFNNFFKRVFVSNIKETCQIRLGHDNTPLSFVYIEGIVLDDYNNCLLSVIDISMLKKQNNFTHD